MIVSRKEKEETHEIGERRYKIRTVVCDWLIASSIFSEFEIRHRNITIVERVSLSAFLSVSEIGRNLSVKMNLYELQPISIRFHQSIIVQINTKGKSKRIHDVWIGSK